MKTTLTKEQFTQLCQRIDREIASAVCEHMKSASLPLELLCIGAPEFSGSPQLVDRDSPRTWRIEVHPVQFRHAIQSFAASTVHLSNACISMTASWRLNGTFSWIREKTFGQDGILCISLAALDEEQIAETAEAYATYVKAYFLNRL